VYERAQADPEAFWAEWAEQLEWIAPWHTVCEWNPPHAKWFVGGKLNVSANCLDRHLQTARRNKAAIIFEGEPGDTRVLTYHDLWREVNRFAGVLKSLGVGRGDRVTIYLPMIPEAAIAMLACTRIGAVHSVVFGGFSADSLRERINDSQSRLLITADGGYRRGNVVALKTAADQALADDACPSIEHVVVYNRTSDPTKVPMTEGRDHWWHRLIEQAPRLVEPEAMDAEDPLYILYTSGSTGKPKGILHTTGGYLTQVHATTKCVFDLTDTDVYWCTADVGWVTGHSYVVYGPLACGATVLMYEGAPDWPARDRFWALIEKYGVSVFYTAPTAIRAFMKWGTEHLRQHDLSSLRLLGSVGEPINPEAWMWYHEHVGRENCPIVDTWWQTETGAIMITPLPGLIATKPGSATRPFPGIEADVVDENGDSVPLGGGGFLVLKRPWPRCCARYGATTSATKTSTGPSSTAATTSRVMGPSATKRAISGCSGRVDDVMLVAGHNISTMEVESALVDHPSVAEAAVIGRTHEIKGQAIAAFVTVKEGADRATSEFAGTLKDHVAKKLGAICRPDDILFTAELPKTRSGKIMRRLLRDIAEGRALGDTTTLADPTVVAGLKDRYESQES
jgi:acetyl-CoA synthetase